jgi:hypothetical protein
VIAFEQVAKKATASKHQRNKPASRPPELESASASFVRRPSVGEEAMP